MEKNMRLIVAIMCLAFPVLACQAIMGGGERGNTPTSTPGPQTLLSDDFTSSKWGTLTDADSSVEYSNGTLQMIVYKKNWFVWSTPANNETYQNVHIETSVINNGTDDTTAFGIICDRQSGTKNFYYAAITPAGEYAIGKATEGQSDKFLTNGDKWSASDAIAENASSYHIGMDCGNGNLTLYVEGQQIASVSDPSYTSGNIALFVWSGENATKTDISFDDFLMMTLP
jgi:hypothetical protein